MKNVCSESLTGKYGDYIISNGDFNTSLQVEKIGQSIADAFYERILNPKKIKRYNYKNLFERSYQMNDIDCTVTCDAVGIGEFNLDISEKFRQFDAGDMCVELWSNFDKKVKGWAVEKTPDICPDIFLYVTPAHIYEVWNNSFFRDMISDIMSEWDWDSLNQFMREDDFKHKRSADSNGRYNIKVGGRDMTLLRTWSKRNGRTWCGVCVCIPWTSLINDYFVDINTYDRNKLNI